MKRIRTVFSLMGIGLLALWPTYGFVQTPAASTQSAPPAVTIIVEPNQVRFTAQQPVQELRLEIRDQAGELIYDSGAVIENELVWAVRDTQGEMINSGLYAYTMTLKSPAEEPRIQQGHLIMDRASQADRLWVTAQDL